MKLKVLTSLMLLCVSSASYANEDSLCSGLGLGGVSVDAENKRVTSVYFQPVKFTDRSGIRKAVVIAEERAKSEIIRFFSQEQSTMRVIEETDATSEEATRLVDENGNTTSRAITRAQSEVLTQVDSSIAAGNLSGMIKIEETYDAEAEEVCVAMGFSARTNAAANSAQNWMKSSETLESMENKTSQSEKKEVGSYQKKRNGNW